MEGILSTKAQQAQFCYQDLLEKTSLTPKTKVVFRVDEGEKELMERACYEQNPFPGIVKPVLLSLRKKAVKRLFEYEKVLQTARPPLSWPWMRYFPKKSASSGAWIVKTARSYAM